MEKSWKIVLQMLWERFYEIDLDILVCFCYFSHSLCSYSDNSNQHPQVINLAELTPLDLLLMREGRRELLELMFQVCQAPHKRKSIYNHNTFIEASINLVIAISFDIS